MYSKFPVKFLGEEHIDENTDKRIKRKFNEHQRKKEKLHHRKRGFTIRKTI